MTESEDQPGVADGGSGVAATAPAMEKVAAGVVLGFGVLMLVGARGIALRNETGGIDPRWWPTVIAVGIIASGVWMLANALLGVSIDREVDPSRRRGWTQMLATVGGLAVVLVLWHFGVTFLLLGPLFLVAINWIYGLRKWTSLLLFPAIIATLLYLVFRLLLKVPL
ncbi:hypothetical protein FOJ82_08615 [Tessaracoccus rhinocerotis]|uniref:DUF1468 domain-containing protein n=1 Tax=Tessaracoccus rhinocerotis TaxID=1689449 RepID=A0A553K078_9ACTN|nr:tripartite tricarboxylate transporter TctB family protein [Tessaracoccus rhinocerotis]TRY18111.1 hypothetical protein FOJ82_08615 [Tessaracoccus rhinocerotis]